MPAERFATAIEPPASRTRAIRGFPAPAIRAVEERLAGAERELRVQFNRMAQLQAELDLASAALRRLSDTVHRLEAIR